MPPIITSILGAAQSAAPGVVNRSAGLGFINLGSALQGLGGQLSAQSYRLAGAASIAAGQYNAGLEQLNLERRLDGVARDIRTVGAEQRVQAVSTGFRGSSKSFLSVMNDTMTGFERLILDETNTSKQRQKSILFEAQTQQVFFENQARTAEYQASVQQAMSASQGSGFGGGFAQQVGGLIGNLFGG